MRPRRRWWITWLASSASLLIAMMLVGIAAVKAVLDPKLDPPRQVDVVVVVAGAQDDRYETARRLAREGLTDQVLVSNPVGAHGDYAAMLAAYCASAPIETNAGRRVPIECFVPDSGTTEGEASAATRVAHARGWKSMLVTTHWGHASRVRLYFEQCFEGETYVTASPRHAASAKTGMLKHEIAGYVKAVVSPAC